MKSIAATIPTTKSEIDAKIQAVRDTQHELTKESTTAGFVRLNGIIRQLAYLKKIMTQLEQAKQDF